MFFKSFGFPIQSHNLKINKKLKNKFKHQINALPISSKTTSKNKDNETTRDELNESC